ncbi:MAG: sigma-70 family RNA polymerase sigma factor [Dehalococcoidia bacterium]|nr:sigma-70 family RNA polymerase sigma factor [Dehalococcoidia bacterium]
MSREKELVERARNGDGQALAELYNANADKVYRYIYLRVRDSTRAEDITQQVFLKVLNAIRSFKWTGAPFTAWLMKIAHNEIIDYFRKESRAKTVTADDRMVTHGPDPEGADPTAMAETSIEIGRIMAALENLPPAQKEVISLRFTGGLTIAEVARVLGKSVGTVKALQFNGILSLRKQLLGERDAAEN